MTVGQSFEQSFPQDIDGLTIWALPTNGSTSVNSRAPSNGWKYQRTEYLITESEMAASGFPSGAIINAIGFYIASSGTGPLSGTLDIYLKNTTDTAYSLGTAWTTFTFTHVSSNNPFSVPVSPSGGIYNITFSGGSPFTYDGGGVYVAWEFSSPSGTPGTLNVTHYCNTSLIDGLYGQRSPASMPINLVASNWRPATRFSTNTYYDMLDISNIYTIEKIPVPFGTPPSVGVRISNVSPEAVTFDLTLTVKDALTSTVRYTATQTLTNYSGYTSSVVNFPGWSPVQLEDVIITASTSSLPDETWTENNTKSITANINNDLYSYNYQMNNPGGYGYTYPNTGIFAAKYTMNGTGIVTGVNVYIYNYPTNIGNMVYAVALNGAGIIVGQSDDYVIQAEDLGTVKNFTFTTPSLFHNQVFYAGLAQTTGIAQWYPLGTFTETPQRGNAFYTFNINGGTPLVNNALIKFGIEAQVAPSALEVIDAGVLSIDLSENQNPGIIIPKATLKNYSTNPKSFNTSITISDGYISTKTITDLAPGDSIQVIFDSWNAQLGQYTLQVCSQLTGDINPDNDCKSKNIGVYTGNWSEGTNFPISTYLGSGIGYKGQGVESTIDYLFSIAGNTTSTLATECFKYNVTSGIWTDIASLPEPRKVLATAVIGDYLYAIGGADLSSIYKNSVFKYSILSNTWTNSAYLPIAVAWGKAAVYKGRIYFAGGINSSGTILSSVYIYDPTTNNWLTGTPLPGPKFGGAFAVAGNKLVYLGGANSTDITGDVYVGTINDVNPYSISWTTAGMYPGLEGAAYKDPGVKLADIMRILSDNALNEELDAYPPGAIYRLDAASWGTNSIIVAGGSPGSAWMPTIPSPCYTFNPYTNLWTKQADVPLPVLGSSLGTVNNGKIWKLIVASGMGIYQVENATQIWTDTTAASTFPLSMTVNANWNLISIPGLHPENQGITTWFPYRDYSANVFRYSGGYQSVTTLEPARGYWLKHNGTRTYNSGDEWPAAGMFVVPHDPIAVNTGWNLIGLYEQTVPTSGLTTTPPGLISGSIYSYTGTGYAVATNLTPGKGYWVKLSGNALLNIPEGTFDKVTDAPGNITEGFGKIIITDNSGKSFTLYAAGSEADLTKYELPPLPPQGMFDIRYSSQRFVENLVTPQGIELIGVQYPLKIKVEGLGIILSDETGKETTRLISGEEVSLNTELGKLMVTVNVLPLVYALEQNYPNPFNPATTIRFSIPEEVYVNLSIYNLLGEKVKEIKNEMMKPGNYDIRFNAADLATGIYFYRLEAGSFLETKKMLLVK